MKDTKDAVTVLSVFADVVEAIDKTPSLKKKMDDLKSRREKALAELKALEEKIAGIDEKIVGVGEELFALLPKQDGTQKRKQARKPRAKNGSLEAGIKASLADGTFVYDTKLAVALKRLVDKKEIVRESKGKYRLSNGNNKK